jgi:hypothetical protein
MSLKQKLVKMGAKVVRHGRYVAFPMAEVAIPRNWFSEILRLIVELRSPSVARFFGARRGIGPLGHRPQGSLALRACQKRQGGAT